MKIAIYLRISTRDKQELNMQKDHIFKYINGQKDWEVYKIYADRGISGTKEKRPALDDMLSELKYFDAVVVYKLDRIGRSMKNVFQLMEIFKKNNIEFISTSQSIDTSKPEGRLFFNMLSAFAQFEAEMTRARIMDGLASARARGKKLGRPKGAKDRKKRAKVNYYIRHQKAREKKELENNNVIHLATN